MLETELRPPITVAEKKAIARGQLARAKLGPLHQLRQKFAAKHEGAIAAYAVTGSIKILAELYDTDIATMQQYIELNEKFRNKLNRAHAKMKVLLHKQQLKHAKKDARANERALAAFCPETWSKDPDQPTPSGGHVVVVTFGNQRMETGDGITDAITVSPALPKAIENRQLDSEVGVRRSLDKGGENRGLLDVDHENGGADTGGRQSVVGSADLPPGGDSLPAPEKVAHPIEPSEVKV